MALKIIKMRIFNQFGMGNTVSDNRTLTCDNRDLKHRRRNGTTTPPTGSEIFPREPSGHALGCQNVVHPSSTTESEQVFALVKT